jgi:hypothetical protein
VHSGCSNHVAESDSEIARRLARCYQLLLDVARRERERRADAATPPPGDATDAGVGQVVEPLAGGETEP